MNQSKSFSPFLFMKSWIPLVDFFMSLPNRAPRALNPLASRPLMLVPHYEFNASPLFVAVHRRGVSFCIAVRRGFIDRFD